MATKIVKAQAPFIPIQQGIRAVIHQTYMGRPYVNVVGLMRHDVGSDVTGVAAALFQRWKAIFVPVLSDKWHLDAVETRTLDTEAGVVELYSEAGIQGDDESAALPRGVAMVLQLSTGGAGRARHGRLYIAGICSSSFKNEENVISDSTTTLLNASLPGLPVMSVPSNATIYLAVLSHSRGPDGVRRIPAKYDEPTNTWTGVQGDGSVHPVSGITIRALVGSQRRRNG